MRGIPFAGHTERRIRCADMRQENAARACHHPADDGATESSIEGSLAWVVLRPVAHVAGVDGPSAPRDAPFGDPDTEV
jgi:hypothetical protein